MIERKKGGEGVGRGFAIKVMKKYPVFTFMAISSSPFPTERASWGF